MILSSDSLLLSPFYPEAANLQYQTIYVYIHQIFTRKGNFLICTLNGQSLNIRIFLSGLNSLTYNLKLGIKRNNLTKNNHTISNEMMTSAIRGINLKC